MIVDQYRPMHLPAINDRPQKSWYIFICYIWEGKSGWLFLSIHIYTANVFMIKLSSPQISQWPGGSDVYSPQSKTLSNVILNKGGRELLFLPNIISSRFPNIIIKQYPSKQVNMYACSCSAYMNKNIIISQVSVMYRLFIRDFIFQTRSECRLFKASVCLNDCDDVFVERLTLVVTVG